MPTPQPVRVLYLEGNVDGTIGGSYYSLLFLLEGLDRTRIEPLLALRRDTPLLPRFERAAAAIWLLEWKPPFVIALRQSAVGKRAPLLATVLSLAQSGVNFTRFLARVFRLASRLRREKVALVHLNNSVTRNHDVMLAALLAGVPCVTHERGLNDEYSLLSRWCARRLAAILCISRAVFDRLVEHGVSRDNLRLVPNGLDPAQVTISRSSSEVRSHYGIPADDRVIGMVGNIRWWKGQEVLIRALPAIVEQVPNVTCLFVGEATASDRPYMQQLESLIAEFGLTDRVAFTGYSVHVGDVLNVMEVAVHASMSPEPFGRVLLEAMAVRKPIVGSRDGAVTEIVQEGITGYTFPPGDHRELAKRVVELLEHPERARAFGEAGYERLVHQFSLTSNVARTMAVYGEVFARRRSR